MSTFRNQDQDVVARVRTSLPRRKHCRPDADVVARALKFGVFVKKHPSPAASVIIRAQTLSPARMRSRLGAGVTAQAGTLCPGADGFGRPTTPARACRRCRLHRPLVHPNFRGYKRPSLLFSPYFPSIRSFLAWTCPPAAPCENLTDRTLAFFSYCVIFLCEPHKCTVHHLHILDYERPYYLLRILQKWRGGGKRQRSGSHGLHGYWMDIR